VNRIQSGYTVEKKIGRLKNFLFAMLFVAIGNDKSGQNIKESNAHESLVKD
jgi:hypothetical protein